MKAGHLIIINSFVLLLSMSYFSSVMSSSSYDVFSNLTHSCKIWPQVVCVDLPDLADNKTCVDPECLIYSGGNHTACHSPLINVMASNLTYSNNVSGVNSSVNATTVATCNATWIYKTNKYFCLNTASWNKSVCGLNNVTCKVNLTECESNPVFYIGGFFNLKSLDGWGNLPAAQLAIDHINNDSTYLSNITLSLTAEPSTQGLLSYGTQLLYSYLYSGPPKLMLLLPQDADLARTVAAYAGLKRWGTLQFSYGTEDNKVASNKKLFPRFYRLNPLEISYNRLRAAFVAAFPQWKDDVGLLYYADPYYEEVNTDLRQKLAAKGINVVANVGFKSNPEEVLHMLKEKNAHVILTSFPYTFGKKLFCKAFKLYMYGPHYVWITFRLMPYKFWIPGPSDDLDCSEYEMTCATENHFSFTGANLKVGNLKNNPNVSFSETYYNLVDVGNSTKNRSWFAPYAYDAVWTMADILKRARTQVETAGKVLTGLSYDDVNETKLLEKLADETDFTGVTGRIRFFENGNRKFEMDVLQVRPDGAGWFVGSYNEDNDIYYPSGIIWIGGKPYERTVRTYDWRYIRLVLFVFWCILAALGIIYGLICLFFIVIYRRERSIKYSSPTINVIIILGCLLNFVAVILYGIDHQRASHSTVDTLCKVRLWIFSLGFTFCIGGLWVKVWTLYQILVERRVYKKRIMEYWMFGIVVVFVLIDVIYLTVWTATDELYRTSEVVQDQPVYQCFRSISGDPFRAAVSYIEVCDCDNLTVWLTIFLTYKALVLLCGFYMSWKVRHVFTRKLVDAQFCAKLLILAVPCCLLGLVFALTLRLQPTPHYALLGIIIIIYSFIVLGVLYAHKIKNILYHPTNKITVRSKSEVAEKRCCHCPPAASSCLMSLCCCCGVACTGLQCCKGLWDALLHGPRKNRGSFVKSSGDGKVDYQIGNMPGDRERQIIILQKQLEKKDHELLQLRRYHRATQAVKQTQTIDACTEDYQDRASRSSSSGLSNEGFEQDSANKHRVGKPHYNRFKVYHRKLDFSHVGSKVDSGLDGRTFKQSALAESPVNGSDQWRRYSQDSEILLLQKTLSERDKELAQLKAQLGMSQSPSIETPSKGGSLQSIREEYSSPDIVVRQPADDNDLPQRSICSVEIAVYPGEPDDERNASHKDDIKQSTPDPSTTARVEDKEPMFVNEATVDQLDVAQHEELLDSTSRSDNEQEGLETVDDKANGGQTKETNASSKRSNVKIFNAPANYSHVQSRLFVGSPYSTSEGRKPPRFKQKVQQLSAFSILKPRSTNITGSSGRAEDRNPDKSDDLQAKENDQNSGNRSNVKIFNASTDYSHVKSRLFDASSSGSQSQLGRPSKSPNFRRGSKVDNDDELKGIDAVRQQDQNGRENKPYEKTQSNVKVFNSPSDYSYVKSRLFDNNTTGSQSSVKNSTGTLTARTASKTDAMNGEANASRGESDQNSAEENSQYSKPRSNVKIFNAPSDYSYVKSRLFDSSSSRNTPENQGSRRFQRKVQQVSSFGLAKQDSSSMPKTPNNRTAKETQDKMQDSLV